MPIIYEENSIRNTHHNRFYVMAHTQEKLNLILGVVAGSVKIANIVSSTP
jgi:hypothetical protein